jgi:hypothetical protein
MKSAVTMAPNPAIDICTTVEKIFPTRKLRYTSAQRDAGGEESTSAAWCAGSGARLLQFIQPEAQPGNSCGGWLSVKAFEVY